VEQGERFLGPAFSERFADNVRVVQSRLDAASLDNVTLLNMAFDLPAYDLTDTEHLTESGKEHVAEQTCAGGPGQGRRAERGSAVDGGPDGDSGSSVSPTDVPSPTPADTAPTPALPATPTATPASAEAVVETVTGGDVTSVRYIDRYRPSGPYPVDLVRITFETVDEEGKLVETQADLYIPYVEAEEAFPVLGHAAGTTGVGNGCAPLDERTTGRSWGAYHSQSLDYAAQGYIVVFPNWLHFDDPQRIHHYFVSDFQAHTLLDAVRAAYRFWDRDRELDTQAEPAQIAFMMGFSSGGHAVFAAKDRAQTYAPELPIEGVIGFGAVTNPGLLLQEDPIFGPYLVYAYRDFYGDELIDPAEVYLPQWVSNFEDDVLSTCVDEIFYTIRTARGACTLPNSARCCTTGGWLRSILSLRRQLAANTAGLGGGADIPVLLLQGTADTVITPPSQRDFRDQLCALGHSVTWMEYGAATHADTRWRSYDDVLAWMADAVQGGAPRSDCPPSE
jgi:hypothetical protein